MNDIMTPMIGITAGMIVNQSRPWAPQAMGQLHTYTEAVLAAGGVPIILPITRDQAVIRRLAASFDGFLFAGGNDINPTCYGEENRYSVELDPARDEFELQLIKQVEQAQKPILAICRGMQLLNVARGGTLYQDINKQLTGNDEHFQSYIAEDYTDIAHQLELMRGTRLQRCVATDSLAANSLHHQAVKRLGVGLVITARTNDTIIEAIEDPGKDFVIGVQCHPESLYEASEPQWLRLFEQFIHASRMASTREQPSPFASLTLDPSSEIELTTAP